MFIVIAVIYVKIYRFVAEQNKKMAAISKLGVPKDPNKENAGPITVEMSSTSSTVQTSSSAALSDNSEPNIRLHFTSAETQLKSSGGTGKNIVQSQSFEISVHSTSSAVPVADRESGNDTVNSKQGKNESHCRRKVETQEPKNKLAPSDNKLNRHHVSVTKKLAIVVLAFLICLILPFGISIAVPTSDAGIPWTAMMMTINSCVNPIIYARTMPVFRHVMGCIIRCHFKNIT